MARPLRLDLAGGLYHVTLRGDRRDNDGDREKWLENVGNTFRRFKLFSKVLSSEGRVDTAAFLQA